MAEQKTLDMILDEHEIIEHALEIIPEEDKDYFIKVKESKKDKVDCFFNKIKEVEIKFNEKDTETGNKYNQIIRAKNEEGLDKISMIDLINPSKETNGHYRTIKNSYETQIGLMLLKFLENENVYLNMLTKGEHMILYNTLIVNANKELKKAQKAEEDMKNLPELTVKQKKYFPGQFKKAYRKEMKDKKQPAQIEAILNENAGNYEKWKQNMTPKEIETFTKNTYKLRYEEHSNKALKYALIAGVLKQLQNDNSPSVFPNVKTQANLTKYMVDFYEDLMKSKDTIDVVRVEDSSNLRKGLLEIFGYSDDVDDEYLLKTVRSKTSFSKHRRIR